MLSKNQARTFFVVGTVFFTGVFFYLSYDTVVNHVDKQTNSQNMSAEVVRGKRLFDENNCMGCHTIMGEGAYYAPELTKVYERRGPDWIDVFMDDPEAMFPGERKMVKYNFTKDRAIFVGVYLYDGLSMHGMFFNQKDSYIGIGTQIYYF